MITVSAETILIKLCAGVTGITRRTDDEKERQDGRAIEVERTTTTRVNDPVEAGAAKKLLNQLRAVVQKHTTSILNLSLTNPEGLTLLRAEAEPIQHDIDSHNAAARFHKVDRALLCAPINLKVDSAAITEINRQIGEELRTARAFFDVEALPLPFDANAVEFKTWLNTLDNWLGRTKGLDKLFPTVTGEMIKQALESVRDLRCKVAESARDQIKTGALPAGALRGALQAVITDDSVLGLIDNAIGFVAITDSAARVANDNARDAGNHVSLEVH